VLVPGGFLQAVRLPEYGRPSGNGKEQWGDWHRLRKYILRWHRGGLRGLVSRSGSEISSPFVDPMSDMMSNRGRLESGLRIGNTSGALGS